MPQQIYNVCRINSLQTSGVSLLVIYFSQESFYCQFFHSAHIPESFVLNLLLCQVSQMEGSHDQKQLIISLEYLTGQKEEVLGMHQFRFHIWYLQSACVPTSPKC